jgi:hypothetical protein
MLFVLRVNGKYHMYLAGVFMGSFSSLESVKRYAGNRSLQYTFA